MHYKKQKRSIFTRNVAHSDPRQGKSVVSSSQVLSGLTSKNSEKMELSTTTSESAELQDLIFV